MIYFTQNSYKLYLKKYNKYKKITIKFELLKIQNDKKISHYLPYKLTKIMALLNPYYLIIGTIINLNIL